MLEHDQFNGPPAVGRQVVLFTVEATDEGEASGTAWSDVSWASVGSVVTTFSTGADDRCEVICDGLSNTAETFLDGICWERPVGSDRPPAVPRGAHGWSYRPGTAVTVAFVASHSW